MLALLETRIAAILLFLGAGVHAEQPFQVDAALRTTLNSRMTVSWTSKPVREALGDLSNHLQLAVLLDRRIDPSLPLDNVHPARVQDLLASIASQSGAALRVVGNVAYVAPESTARIIRTLVALRTEELSRVPSSRAVRLRRPSTLVWKDLDRPDEILAQIAERYELGLEGLDLIPLDMWAGATLPEMSAAEQLALVLVQLDLTFEWQPNGRGLRVVPIPEVVALRREYPISRGRAAVLAQRGREEIRGIETEAEGRTVRAWGTVEQHEQLAELLRSGRSGSLGRSVNGRRSKRPTSQRVFSLRVAGGTLEAVLNLLEAKHGFRIVVDRPSLASAGVSIEQQVQLDVERVSIGDLLEELLEPIGLKHEVLGKKIRVFAAAER